MNPLSRDEIIQMVAAQIIDGALIEGIPEDEMLARVVGTGPDSPVLFMFAEPVSEARILLVMPRKSDDGTALGATQLIESFPEMVADLITQANDFARRLN